MAHEVNSIYYLTAAINIMDIYPSINNLLNTHQLHPSKNEFAYSIISNMINKLSKYIVSIILQTCNNAVGTNSRK